jgi:hypothetical protein
MLHNDGDLWQAVCDIRDEVRAMVARIETFEEDRAEIYSAIHALLWRSQALLKRTGTLQKREQAGAGATRE